MGCGCGKKTIKTTVKTTSQPKTTKTGGDKTDDNKTSESK
jgi:hypothetical protein